MPKVASHRLTWSLTHQNYQWQETHDQTLLDIVPESVAWFAWLDQLSSFAFWGKRGHYTARKERRARGEAYWYAYVGLGKKLSKKYLGKTSDVTLARLEQVAAEFGAAHDIAVEMLHRPAVARESLPTTFPVPAAFRSEGREVSEPIARRAEAKKQRDPLLATKLHVPRPRAHLVYRSHLTGRLQQGMEQALTLVSAPAGFGKTTLLAQWLSESDAPVAWLSLEPEDNDPARFFAYVIAALESVDARIGTSALALLRAPGFSHLGH